MDTQYLHVLKMATKKGDMVDTTLVTRCGQDCPENVLKADCMGNLRVGPKVHILEFLREIFQ